MLCIPRSPFSIPLTPWCRVLLEKLTGLQLVKKFAAFHGTRRFITALTSVRHPSLSWASPIQSIYPHPTSRRSILILSTQLSIPLTNQNFYVFLVAFVKMRKVTISCVMSLSLSLYLSACPHGKNSSPTGRIFMKFDI